MNPKDIEILTLIGNLCTGSGTFILAITAIWGLGQWREQMRYKEKYELAHKIVLLVGRLIREYKNVPRHNHNYSMLKRPKLSDERPEFQQNLDEKYALVKGFEPLSETVEELKNLNWEAKVILNDDLGLFIEEYETILKEISFAIRNYFDEAYLKNDELLDKLRTTIYEQSLLDKIEHIAEKIKAKLERHFI